MNKATVIALCFVLVVAVVAGVEALNQSNSLEVVKIDKEVIEVNPNLHLLEDEDAVQAAKDVLRRKELEADKNSLEGQIEALQSELELVDKELGVYWTVKANILAEIRKTFPESPNTAVAVAYAESGLRMVQSNHSYPKDMDGQRSGSRERSFCLYQIHEPAHDANAKRLGLGDYKTNPESCIKMARVIYDQAGGWSPWTVYQKKMHLAYVR